MSAPKTLPQLLGVDATTADKIAPLLADAATALEEVKVPSETEIHELVSGAYRFTQNNQSLESEDTDRRLEEAMKNLSKWREHAQVYLSGAAAYLRKLAPGISRYESKKRVLAALRATHPTNASEHFYFTRETGAELPADLAASGTAPLSAPPAKGATALMQPPVAALLAARTDTLTDEQRDLLVRLLAIPSDPRSPEAGRIVAYLARIGERVVPSVLRALARPKEAAENVEGEANELLIGVRQLVPRLPEAVAERVLRAAIEAGWVEWIDRPLLEPPLASALREKLLRDYGTRQEPRGNPYRPTEVWFYNLDPA